MGPSARIVVTLLLYALAARAQFVSGGNPSQSPPSPTGNYSLSGTVVTSTSGEPIPHALVQLMGMQQRVAMTDSSGSFAFDHLAAGQATLTARKPGFFSVQRSERGEAAQVAVGLDTAAVTLKLAPEAIIFGHIQNTAGEPLEGANVRLLSSRIMGGRRTNQPRTGIRTDEEGNFRIANLEAGTYYLSVGGGRDLPSQIDTDAPQDGYPAVVFYPGVADFAAASPIRLQPGQQVEADFKLKPIRVYNVFGRVVGFSPELSFGVQLVTGPPGEARLATRSEPSGEFEALHVPPGNYLVTADSRGRNGQNLYAEVPLNVSADVSGLVVPLVPAISIPVVERDEFTSPESTSRPLPANVPRFSIWLQAVDGERGQGHFDFSHDGVSNKRSMSLNDVRPGVYNPVFNVNGPWYVATAVCGSTDLLQQPLTVAAGTSPQPIEVTLRDDAASLSGTVALRSDSAPVHLLLYSNSAPMRPPQEGFASAPQGMFGFSGIAPGDYTVVALDRIDDLEYMNPAAMQEYLGRGKRISLQPGEKARVSLDVIRRSE